MCIPPTTSRAPSSCADGKRKQFEFTATRAVRELVKDAAVALGIPEQLGDVLLLRAAPGAPITLAGTASPDRRVIDAGLVGDVEARRFPAPKSVIVRVITRLTMAPAAAGACSRARAAWVRYCDRGTRFSLELLRDAHR